MTDWHHPDSKRAQFTKEDWKLWVQSVYNIYFNSHSTYLFSTPIFKRWSCIFIWAHYL